jgi:membrane protease subunit (stomatin/prohibitin family)
MGLFSSFTNETKRNFVARPDEAKQDILYKYPEKNIRTMTQLTCQPDEVAIFVKGGKVMGKLGPGTHSLDSSNIPFLSAILEKFTGGNLFVAELYFVTTREVPSIRFGGPLGSVTDNVTQMMCDAMVYGDFSVQVLDPEKLLFGLVGTGTELQNGNSFLNWFKAILLKYLSDAVGELGEKGWALNKMISPHYKLELQKALLEQIREEVDRYGIKVVQFGNFVLSISDEDKAELNKRNMAIADDQRRMNLARDPAYVAVAQTEMMRNAGVGMAKGGEGAGGALAGMGMGMGFQMANMIGQTMATSPASPPSTTATPQLISCPSCTAQTPAGKFCNSCGKPLVQTATNVCECGAQLAAGAKFCSQCGKSTGPKKCICGTELPAGTKFCPNCGKPA